MAQGFAFGTGSALAREAVGSVFGGSGSAAPAAPAPQQEQPMQQPMQSAMPQACEFDQKQFVQCLQQNAGNVSACDQYYSALQMCQSRM